MVVMIVLGRDDNDVVERLFNAIYRVKAGSRDKLRALMRVIYFIRGANIDDKIDRVLKLVNRVKTLDFSDKICFIDMLLHFGRIDVALEYACRFSLLDYFFLKCIVKNCDMESLVPLCDGAQAYFRLLSAFKHVDDDNIKVIIGFGNSRLKFYILEKIMEDPMINENIKAIVRGYVIGIIKKIYPRAYSYISGFSDLALNTLIIDFLGALSSGISTRDIIVLAIIKYAPEKDVIEYLKSTSLLDFFVLNIEEDIMRRLMKIARNRVAKELAIKIIALILRQVKEIPEHITMEIIRILKSKIRQYKKRGLLISPCLNQQFFFENLNEMNNEINENFSDDLNYEDIAYICDGLYKLLKSGRIADVQDIAFFICDDETIEIIECLTKILLGEPNISYCLRSIDLEVLLSMLEDIDPENYCDKIKWLIKRKIRDPKLVEELIFCDPDVAYRIITRMRREEEKSYLLKEYYSVTRDEKALKLLERKARTKKMWLKNYIIALSYKNIGLALEEVEKNMKKLRIKDIIEILDAI